MNKKMHYLILILLFLWLLLLLYRHKELTRCLLHAERSATELLSLENLRARYLITPVDSLFETGSGEGLLLMINRDENSQTIKSYLQTHFPAWPLIVVANRQSLPAGCESCDSRISFPESLDIPLNILCYYRRDTCRYFFLYEPANPWRLALDMKILRKFYEKNA
ncbi:MAG: hypothetical protein J7K63_09250 [Candidatus Marinimicrobia bacterium]|nr:hypothetical protein [Candidatus Neomarinimicrobiota bacterium]